MLSWPSGLAHTPKPFSTLWHDASGVCWTVGLYMKRLERLIARSTELATHWVGYLVKMMWHWPTQNGAKETVEWRYSNSNHNKYVLVIDVQQQQLQGAGCITSLWRFLSFNNATAAAAYVMASGYLLNEVVYFAVAAQWHLQSQSSISVIMFVNGSSSSSTILYDDLCSCAVIKCWTQ